MALSTVSLIAAAGCEGKAGPAPVKRSDRAAPPLRLKALDGSYFDLAETTGDVVLVNVWATWCEPCKKELPELARLHKEHGSRGFQVVAVSIDVPRKEKAVRNMAKKFALPFTVLLDPTNQSVVDWKVSGYPTSFVISREGEQLWRRDGMIFDPDEELDLVLQNALAEAPTAPKAETAP